MIYMRKNINAMVVFSWFDIKWYTLLSKTFGSMIHQDLSSILHTRKHSWTHNRTSACTSRTHTHPHTPARMCIYIYNLLCVETYFLNNLLLLLAQIAILKWSWTPVTVPNITTAVSASVQRAFLLLERDIEFMQNNLVKGYAKPCQIYVHIPFYLLVTNSAKLHW